MPDERSPVGFSEVIEFCAPPRSPEEIVAALRSGVTDLDRAFDRFLPLPCQRVSVEYWTPLEVVVRAAHWINEVGAKSVIDIGSGAGKFCVAAATVNDASYLGLEQRSNLVETARALAHTFGVAARVSFVCGALGEVALPQAEVYYLYNPFGENLRYHSERLDHEVELSAARYTRDVHRTGALLRAAPAGSYVITYNGFGGFVPPRYQRHRADYLLPNELRMWRKS